MMKTDRLTVKYHGDVVGVLSLTPDDRSLAFEYDPYWIADGFSISPLELPLRKGLFLANRHRFMETSVCLRIVCRMVTAVISCIRLFCAVV